MLVRPGSNIYKRHLLSGSSLELTIVLKYSCMTAYTVRYYMHKSMHPYIQRCILFFLSIYRIKSIKLIIYFSCKIFKIILIFYYIFLFYIKILQN
jgi:hypothetical protein